MNTRHGLANAMQLLLFTFAGVVYLLTITATNGVATAELTATSSRNREVVVHVVDHTNGTWPVKPAMRAWSKMRGVRFKSATDCTDIRRYCVIVDAWDHQASGWMGLTTYLTRRLSHVQLNDTAQYHYAAGTRAQRRAIVCHELAHTLGAPHPSESAGVWGCIANSDHAHTTPKPTRADRALLRQVMANPGGTWGAFQWQYLRSAGLVG